MYKSLDFGLIHKRVARKSNPYNPKPYYRVIAAYQHDQNAYLITR